MTAQTNKDTFRSFIEGVVNNGNFDLIDKTLASDVKEHELLPPGYTADRNGVKRMFQDLKKAFPDLTVKIHQLVAEGDKVVANMTWTGTHKGAFLGTPASNKKATFNVIDIVRIDNNKIVEHWGLTDQLTMLQQIGAVQPPQVTTHH